MHKHVSSVHRIFSMLYTIVVTNQCPNCMSILSAKNKAYEHLRTAYNSMRCLVDRSAHDTIDECPLDCPVCDFVAQDLPRLQEHIRERHAPHPRPSIVLHVGSQIREASSSDEIFGAIEQDAGEGISCLCQALGLSYMCDDSLCRQLFSQSLVTRA